MITSFATSPFWTPFLTSAFAALITTVGIYVIRRFDTWGHKNTTYFACFAAGVLISISFLHLIPTALGMSEHAPIYILGGYLFMHFFSRFVTAHLCDKPHTQHYAIGLVPMVGIGIHSFIDGITYSVTFAVSTYTGFLTALGLILHEFPEGVVMFLMLARGGFSRPKAAFLAFIAAALTTPLGMVLSYPIVSQIDRPTLGILLSVAAGALIYVGATHLLPRTETEPKKYSLIALGTGILVAIAMNFSSH
jgi:zinc and cadmium transporter